MDSLDNLIKTLGIKEIDPSRNYWLVRTQSGIYFEEFHIENYIAIGWDEINDLPFIKNSSAKELKERIEMQYPDENRPGGVANQIKKFVIEMKKGDIVIIPSENSRYIAFGELAENEIYTVDPIEFEEIEEIEICPFQKRRQVKWLKVIKRDDLDPYLYKLLNSHHAITNANEYAPFIDRSLHTFFKKGDKAHVIFEVTETKEIPAVKLLNFMQNNLCIVDEFNSLSDSNLNLENIDIKINVQSPGPIEFLGDPYVILLIAVVGVVLAGGGVKFKQTFESVEGEIKTDGLIEKIGSFINIIQKNGLANKRLENNYKEAKEILKVRMPVIDSAKAYIEEVASSSDENNN